MNRNKNNISGSMKQKEKRRKRMIRTTLVSTLCVFMVGGAAQALAAAPQVEDGVYTAENGMQEGGEYTIENGRLTIQEAGTYILTGKMQGTVYVDPGVGEVILVMDNAVIEGGSEPAILAVSGDALKIEMEKGSVNRISDSKDNSKYQAAIYSKIDTAIDGKGLLQVNGKQRYGFCVENANLSFDDGKYLIVAEENAFATGQGTAGTIQFQGGEFAANVKGEIFAENINPAMNGIEIQKTDKTDIEEVFANETKNTSNRSASKSVKRDKNSDPTDKTDKNSEEITESPAEDTSDEKPEKPEKQPSESNGGESRGEQAPEGQPAQPQGNQQPSGSDGGRSRGEAPGMMQPGNMEATSSVDQAGEIVEGMTTNSAASLEADYENAITIVLSDDNSTAKISDSGTYVISGTSSDGSITVKKGTTGVVLVLNDLDLTSTSSATLSVNKEAEVKIIVEGNVTLTDAENPADEYSEDAEVADAYDGAALKGKANSVIYVTGNGTLTINGNAKNGIKMGDDSSLVIDGDLDINIVAANDGINSNYDVAIQNGDITIDAGDDAIHADHILTIGNEDGTGPDIDITKSNEGLEATVINIKGGDIDIVSSDDAINAANKDGVYKDELEYSVNITGGDITINSKADGIDSNGNVNLIDGSATISSANNGGDAGIDYDGDLYISEDFELNNRSGVSGPDGMPGSFGGQGTGEMPGQNGSGMQNGGSFGGQGTGEMPGQNGSGMQNGGSFGGQGTGEMPGQNMGGM